MFISSNKCMHVAQDVFLDKVKDVEDTRIKC